MSSSKYFKLMPPGMKKKEAMPWLKKTVANFNRPGLWFIMGDPSFIAFESEHGVHEISQCHNDVETGKKYKDIICIDKVNIADEIERTKVPFRHHIVYNPRLKGKKSFKEDEG